MAGNQEIFFQCGIDMRGEIASEFFAELSDDLFKARVYTKIFIVYSILLLIRCYALHNFPNGYTWGELFINYQGGFVRRGLIGELLYQCQAHISARWLALLSFSAIYFFTVFYAYKMLTACFDKLTVILVFATPAFFLFYITDTVVFMRKDMVIILLLLITTRVTVRAFRHEGGLILPASIFALCFALAVLCHEIAIFYFPLPAMLLVARFARGGKTWICLALIAALYACALFMILQYPGTYAARDAIYASWRAYLPNFSELGGLQYIGQSINDPKLLPLTRAYHSDAVIMRSVAAALFLSLLPFFFLCAGYHPFRAMRAILPPPWLYASGLLAFIPLIFPSLFAMDFGRHIAMGCIAALFFLAAVCSVQPQPRAPWLARLLASLRQKPETRYWAIAIIFAYSTSWTLLHYNEPGHSYLIPAGLYGEIFNWITRLIHGCG